MPKLEMKLIENTCPVLSEVFIAC